MLQLTNIGTRSVATVPETANAAQIADLMHDRSVGSVVIVRDKKPVGIVTDRDLVMRVLRKRLDPAKVAAVDVMSKPVAAITHDEDALTAAALMNARQVRRLPVLGADGSLAGIICLDDLIHILARTHHELAETVASFPVPYSGG